jgi:hypothetical protein
VSGRVKNLVLDCVMGAGVGTNGLPTQDLIHFTLESVMKEWSGGGVDRGFYIAGGGNP